MRTLLRPMLAICFGFALVRAALFLGDAALGLGSPTDVYHLESQMVHLSWRVQHGRALYPDWRSYPHVINAFGPLYFLAVGWASRLAGADLDGIYRIGRATTLGAAMAAAALVGLASGRRDGRGAGAFAALMALGSAPMIGFGTMTRPDIAADTLGVAGFLLAVGRPSRGRFGAGAALLVAAIFTKQTMGLYLIAAVVALWLTGRRRGAIGLAAGSGVAIGAMAAIVTATVEPHFARDLFGSAATPVQLVEWARDLARLWRLGPELPVLAAFGIALWAGRPGRDTPLAVLAAVMLAGGVLMATKSGADLNYFLGLRLVAALAAGAFWGAAVGLIRGPDPHPDPARPRPVAVALVGLAMLVVGLMPSLGNALARLQLPRSMRAYPVTADRTAVAHYRRIFRLAEDPDVAILTDSGMVAARQGDRAAFADPWTFRIQVLTGEIRPRKLRRRLEAGAFDYVITTRDLFDAVEPYDSYKFGLPPELAEAARLHYEPSGVAGGLFLYEPRPGRGPGG